MCVDWVLPELEVEEGVQADAGPRIGVISTGLLGLSVNGAWQ